MGWIQSSSFPGLKADPVTEQLLGCRLFTGKSGFVKAALRKIQGRVEEGGVQVLRPAPDKLLVFQQWNAVPESLIEKLFGFKPYKLGFEAVEYRIPGLFQPGVAYDLVNDRTIVFEPLPDSECPCSVIRFYAELLSASEPAYQFSELDGKLVAMASRSLLTDNAQHIAQGAIMHYTERRPDVRPRYVMSGSASAHAVTRGVKLRIPESFVIREDVYDELIEEQERSGKILPSRIDASVVIEQLSATDDLDVMIRKCTEYITQDRCTATVILLADTYSMRLKKKLNEVHKFTVVAGKVNHDRIPQPKFVDLGPGIPNCRLYFAYTISKFKAGRKGERLIAVPLHERVGLLCDAVSAGDVETVKLLIAGLSSVNVFDQAGRLPLVEACKVGNREIVEWLLQEGAWTDMEDKQGIWPALAANSSIRALVPSSRALDLSAAMEQNQSLLLALVQAGADPSQQNVVGKVPLIEAVREQVPLAAFKFLVENSSNLNVEDADGFTALGCARKRKLVEYEQVLLQNQCLGTESYKRQSQTAVSA